MRDGAALMTAATRCRSWTKRSKASQSPLTTMHRSCATACLCVERHPLYPRESRGQSVRVGLLQHGLRRAVRVPGDAPPARRVAHGAGLRRARQRLSRLPAALSRLHRVRRRGMEPAAATVMRHRLSAAPAVEGVGALHGRGPVRPRAQAGPLAARQFLFTSSVSHELPPG